jgi:hypothetical protein
VGGRLDDGTDDELVGVAAAASVGLGGGSNDGLWVRFGDGEQAASRRLSRTIARALGRSRMAPL